MASTDLARTSAIEGAVVVELDDLLEAEEVDERPPADEEAEDDVEEDLKVVVVDADVVDEDVEGLTALSAAAPPPPLPVKDEKKPENPPPEGVKGPPDGTPPIGVTAGDFRRG